ncbi:MAG: glycerophosphodiester phosphodiesterase, partial [Clostridia bacterium]|nr:glycerophosphodiester phosphodiesterase [Clostridia bacterium]
QLSEDFVEANYPKDQPVAQFIATHMLTNFRTRPDFVAYRFADRKKLPAAVACKLLEAQEVSWTIRSLEDMLEAEKDGAIVIFEKFIP